MASKVRTGEAVECPHCKSEHTVRHGYNRTKKGKFPRRKCQECGTTFYESKEAEK
jgi:transposase-like protein